ncbi:hypothetical protein MTR_8g038920 [Medicago truncatula]|uniref:Uncharacterized protein n=1 Tax=Medicago truncatula TaxID=3880 RepID=G7LG06_MEDTR|nr:hypothetical protein MTR_8g038920 [Medicago truncatula]
MGSKWDIEKFTGDNDFGLWKVKVEAVLKQQKGDWAQVDLQGSERCPVLKRFVELHEIPSVVGLQGSSNG